MNNRKIKVSARPVKTKESIVSFLEEKEVAHRIKIKMNK